MPGSEALAARAAESIGWRAPSFITFGAVGFAVGSATGLSLALATGRSVAVVAGMAAASAVAFFAVAITTKVASGDETLTFYHHAFAVTLVCAALLLMAGAPLLPYLDLAAVGLLAFLTFGRLGCHVAGCCHGRPHGWGIRYSTRPESGALPAYLTGVTLLPVQLFEAATSAAIALLGVAAVLSGSVPGTALVWCVTAYAASRFIIEFGRGDEVRRYVAGISVPQWTSLAVAGCCMLLAASDRLPGLPIAASFTISIGVGVLAVVLPRGSQIARFDLLAPAHVHEMSHLLELASATMNPSAMVTSRGLVLSTNSIIEDGETTRVYSFSHSSHVLSPRMASRLARTILLLSQRDCDWTALTGSPQGVFHLVCVPGGHERHVGDPPPPPYRCEPLSAAQPTAAAVPESPTVFIRQPTVAPLGAFVIDNVYPFGHREL